MGHHPLTARVATELLALSVGGVTGVADISSRDGQRSTRTRSRPQPANEGKEGDQRDERHRASRSSARAAVTERQAVPSLPLVYQDSHPANTRRSFEPKISFVPVSFECQ